MKDVKVQELPSEKRSTGGTIYTTRGRVNSIISWSVSCDISSRTLWRLEYAFSLFKNLSTMSFVDVRLRDAVSDKKIQVYVSDVTENAPVNFLSFYKTFHSFEMYSVGERTPQRNYFLFPSVERPLLFNEKKQIFSQTRTTLNLNGKVCNTALKTR